MSDPYAFDYPSPLDGYTTTPTLAKAENVNDEQKKHANGNNLSSAYSAFGTPLDNRYKGAFDVHIYYNKTHVPYARELYQRIKLEFPEVSIYRFWDEAIGPHPIPMFECQLSTPAQFGAFIPWLTIWRGPLSVLVHPNTISEGESGRDDPAESLRNHTQRATWMGEKLPLDLTLFYQWIQERRKAE